VTAMNLRRVLQARWKPLTDCDPRAKTGGRASYEISIYVQARNQPTAQSEPLTLAQARTVMAAYGDPPIYRLSESREAGLRGAQAGLSIDAILVVPHTMHGTVVSWVADAVATACRGRQQGAPAAGDELRALLTQTTFCRFSDRSRNAWNQLPLTKHPALIANELDGFSRLLLTSVHFGLLKAFVVFGALTMLLFLVPGVTERIRRREGVRAILRFVLRSRRSLLPVAGGFVLFHALLAVLMWLNEVGSAGVRSSTEFLNYGVPGVLKWVFVDFILRSQAPPLDSSYAKLCFAGLRGGWALMGIVLTYRFGVSLNTRWRRMAVGRPSQHVVIVGWNQDALAVVDELRRQRTHFFVAAWRAREHIRTDIDDDQFVPIIDLGGCLDQLNPSEARALLLLSDAEQAEAEGEKDVDLWVCKTIRRIRMWEAKRGVPPCYVVAEAVSASSVELLEHSGADEVVCVRSFGIRLLAHAATKHRVLRVFGQLLETGDGTDEIYFVPIEPEDVEQGYDFASIARRRMQRNLPDESPQIPMVRRRTEAEGRGGYEIVLNPAATLDPKRDELIVVAKTPSP